MVPLGYLAAGAVIGNHQHCGKNSSRKPLPKTLTLHPLRAWLVVRSFFSRVISICHDKTYCPNANSVAVIGHYVCRVSHRCKLRLPGVHI